MLADANGIPPALKISPADRHDSKLLEPLVDAVPPSASVRVGHDGWPSWTPIQATTSLAADGLARRVHREIVER